MSGVNTAYAEGVCKQWGMSSQFTSPERERPQECERAKAFLITNYPQPRNDGTNQEHAAVSASLNDGAQQGPVSKGPQ
jgi:hypothetical protein